MYLWIETAWKTAVALPQLIKVSAQSGDSLAEKKTKRKEALETRGAEKMYCWA